MRELNTAIEIEASAEKVWKVLTDFSAYPSWNPSIHQLTGEVKEGSRIKVLFQMEGKRGFTFRPRILKVQPEYELRWRGSLGVPGLFDGEHVFLIEPVSVGKVKFIQKELFSGLLVPLIWKIIGSDTEAGFKAMNLALKARAEGAD